MASDINDNITFAGTGLNTDDDLVAIPKGDSRYRLNVVVSDDGNYQVLVNAKGNVLKTVTLPTGTNKVIGFVPDKEENRGLYFLYNSNGDHSILQYSSSTDTVTYWLDGTDSTGEASITVGDLLNFDADSFIDAEILGNEDTKFLAFTDNINPPRLMDMTKVPNFGTATGYNILYEDVITHYKLPPIDAPVVTYGTDSSSNKGNNLRGSLWQITIRYTYQDNTKSTVSPYSNIPIPTDEETCLKTYNISNTANNYLNISFTILYGTGSPGVFAIKSYDVLYRQVTLDGAVGDWYLFDTFDYVLSGARTVVFYNDTGGVALDQDDILRPYDYVPDLARVVTSINSNRFVYGGVFEGQVIDFASAPTIDLDTSIDDLTGSEDPLVSYVNTGSPIGPDTGTPLTATITLPAVSTGYSVIIRTGIATGVSDADMIYLSVTDVSSFSAKSDLATYFINNLNDKYSTVAFTNSSDNILVTNNDTVYSFYFDYYYFDKNVINYSWKTGATHYFGIRYGFNGKLSYVYKDSNTEVYNPSMGESDAYTNNNQRTDIDWELGDGVTPSTAPAPTGATDYQWVYLGSDVDYSEQYFVEFINNDTLTGYEMYPEGDYFVIEKTALADKIKGSYDNPSLIYGFDVQVGDRIRLLGEFSTISAQTVAAGHSIVGSSDVVIYDDLYDFSVVAVDDTLIYVDVGNLDDVVFSLLPVTKTANMLIEIYRPKTVSNDGIYQEISPVYTIVGGNHGTLSGTFNFGDVFVDRLIYSNTRTEDESFRLYSGFLEKKSYSLLFDSIIQDWGRSNTVNDDAVQKEYFKIRYSGPFIDEAGVNYISTFDFDDERDVDDRNGVVTYMKQIGNTLRVYQERKINSFYLAGITSIDANNALTVSSSTQIMDTSARQFIEDFGCTHFSSFGGSVKTNYFFDVNNAAVVRDSSNGLVEVSDYKMHSFFEQLTKRMIQDVGIDNMRITGTFNDEYNMYLISFYDTSVSSNNTDFTLGFHEPTNRWISYYSYIPEFYGNLAGKFTLAFNAGAAYLQDQNDTRNNFFASQYDSEVYVHSNEAGSLNKVYDSIEINSEGVWYMPDDDSIEITYPIAMQSRLKEGKLLRQEGIYRSEFLKDLLSGSSSPVAVNIVQGRSLRGYEITNKMVNDDTTEAVLRSVTINSSISK
jgi:hypothetical protein